MAHGVKVSGSAIEQRIAMEEMAQVLGMSRDQAMAISWVNLKAWVEKRTAPTGRNAEEKNVNR